MNNNASQARHVIEFLREEEPDLVFTHAEAQLIARSGITLSTLTEMIDRHKVVSFDVFDTLLARKTAKPTGVFAYMERVHKADGFCALRVKAEALARQRFSAPRKPETSLEQIYAVLQDIAPALTLTAQDELRAETQFTFADPAIGLILKIARARGKRVIAVSDIYLSGAQVNGLLTAHGIKVDAVYSSSDHRENGFGKFNGRMYIFVALSEGVPTNQIIHFGDNEVADVVHAHALGLSAVHVKARRDLAEERAFPFAPKSTDAGNPALSLIKGQIEASAPHLCAGFSDLYAFGYCIGGPVLAGFAKFIEEQSRQDGVERLVLLARDGYVIEQALTILGIDGPSFSVMPISRRMALLPLMDGNHEFALRSMFSGLGNDLSPKDYFEQLYIDPGNFSKSPEFEKPTSKIDFIVNYQEQIIAAALSERPLFKRYLRHWIGDRAERTALVDVGWGLTTIKSVDLLIGDGFRGYFFGKQENGYHRPGLKGYLFDKSDGTDTEKKFKGGLELLELIFSDTRPAFIRVEEQNGALIARSEPAGPMEMSRNLAISDVRAGVKDFLTEFRSFGASLTAADMKSYLLPELTSLLTQPQIREYRALARVPHSRGMGHRAWKGIGEFWKPASLVKTP